ncbi:MAG: glutamyl-tRNA reductase, partial [Anaerolineales bacterium]
MKTICLGFSHHTAPLQLREQLYYPPAALQTALARFGCGHDAQSPGVAELAILSTCNRVELYAAAEEGTGQRAQFDALLNFICETRHMRRSAISGHAYRYGAREALQHLCRVAAGLDSPVLGEPQILGQVAAAHAVARGQGVAGPVLAAFFRTAIRAGKRARAETAISRNPASVGSLAAQRAAQVVEDLAEASVLVVGAGEMGMRAAEALRSHGVRRIGVANRTQRRAAELAQRWAGRA